MDTGPASAVRFPASELRSISAERRRDCIAERDAGGFTALCSAISGAPRCRLRGTDPGASFILAFQALPLVLTISALASLLLLGHSATHHRGIRLAAAPCDGDRRRVGAWRRRTCVRRHDRGAAAGASLSRARMQRGELFALMTCGMAGVAGTVMVIYASFLAPLVTNTSGTS